MRGCVVVVVQPPGWETVLGFFTLVLLNSRRGTRVLGLLPPSGLSEETPSIMIGSRMSVSMTPQRVLWLLLLMRCVQRCTLTGARLHAPYRVLPQKSSHLCLFVCSLVWSSSWRARSMWPETSRCPGSSIHLPPTPSRVMTSRRDAPAPLRATKCSPVRRGNSPARSAAGQSLQHNAVYAAAVSAVTWKLRHESPLGI